MTDIRKYDKYKSYADYIVEYGKAQNAASGSRFDANANVESKNVATLSGEIFKGEEIGTNRYRMIQKITEMYGEDMARSYINDLERHVIYRCDETHATLPYCVSITMYPFILDGLASIGGTKGEPKHLSSFCGQFINLVFAVAAQFAGAVATPEFLVYLDHFIRLEYGDDYYLHTDEVTNARSSRPRTIFKEITDCFEQIVYTLNAPAAARNYQAVFWNVAYYDRPYFDAIFGEFVFPDGDEPKYESLAWLQENFMEWLRNTRVTKEWLTFPVETANAVYDKATKEYYDYDFVKMCCKLWSRGHSFFFYNNDSADSLSSCCRLKNGITSNVFSYTLGAGGISTGSKAVITMNINRIVQNAVRDGKDISDAIREQIRKNHKYLLAFNEILKEEKKAGLLPVYDAGYISLEKQYLTTGILGYTEAAEFLGIDISTNEKYYDFLERILAPAADENRKAKTSEVMFNTEAVPGENMAVKFAAWDKKDGYFVPRDCYNSYFFRADDDTISVLDKMKLHGDRVIKHLDGGSACHINLAEHLSEEQYMTLAKAAARFGCSYYTFNIPNTICNECGHIDKHYLEKCPCCGTTNVDYITRIIGYAKRISKWSEQRQKEAQTRFYDGEAKTEISE